MKWSHVSARLILACVCSICSFAVAPHQLSMTLQEIIWFFLLPALTLLAHKPWPIWTGGSVMHVIISRGNAWYLVAKYCLPCNDRCRLCTHWDRALSVSTYCHWVCDCVCMLSHTLHSHSEGSSALIWQKRSRLSPLWKAIWNAKLFSTWLLQWWDESRCLYYFKWFHDGNAEIWGMSWRWVHHQMHDNALLWRAFETCPRCSEGYGTCYPDEEPVLSVSHSLWNKATESTIGVVIDQNQQSENVAWRVQAVMFKRRFLVVCLLYRFYTGPGFCIWHKQKLHREGQIIQYV